MAFSQINSQFLPDLEESLAQALPSSKGKGLGSGKSILPVAPQTIKFKATCLRKSTGKQSHKGGCPQEALILVNVTVLGSSLVSNY